MTSRIIVNNIQSDTGVSTVTFNSNISVNGSVSSSSGGISIGTGVSISSPSANTLKINAGIANSDAVTIGGGNFLYGVPSNAVYDTNGGANVGDYWFGQFGSPSRGNSGTKVMVGAAGTISFVGFAHTNSSNVSIISSIVESRLFSNTAGSESGLLNILTKPSTSRTVTALSIDGAGRVTKPLQPSFRAGRNSGYNPGANADIVFNTTSGTFHHNTGGHYSTSNGRFTCPVAGKYLISFEVIWQDITNNSDMSDACYIYVNGGLAMYSFQRGFYVSGSTGSGGYYVDFGTCILSLNATDYVTIRNNRNYTVHGNEYYSWFAGHLLG